VNETRDYFFNDGHMIDVQVILIGSLEVPVLKFNSKNYFSEVKGTVKNAYARNTLLNRQKC